MKNIFNSQFILSILFSLLFYTNSDSVLLADQIKNNVPSNTVNVTANSDKVETGNQNIRILIDVSGSMKKNDPKNLRSPALRLLVGLLPTNSSSAVWNFGTKVIELVKLAKVDEKWKLDAKKASNKIHSKDLFTNIGQALLTASKDWINSEQITEQGMRNIILLTDGMVDISKDKTKNQIERNRILTDLLPQISAKNIQINTIALSNKADFEFLKKLSLDSDGNFESAENADALERLFFHLFEKTVKPDTLPLIDNKFIVDDSVYEMTLLIFKDKSAKNQTTEIIEPSGKSYTKKSIPKYVKWQSEKNYDLLTIQKPFVGDWKINASIDPDNRVMVVTNLKIQTNFLPNNIFLGEEINVQIMLQDQKEIITNEEFLQLTSISVLQASDEKRAEKKWFLHDNGLSDDIQAHDGRFDIKLGKHFKIGKNPYIIRASSDTFARELQQVFQVYDIPLLSAELELIEKNSITLKRVRVSPNLEYINPHDIKIYANLYNENNEPQRVDLIKDDDRKIEWYFSADNLDANEDYYIIFHMETHSRRGRAINYNSKKIYLNLNKIINNSLTIDNNNASPIKVTVTKAKESIEKPNPSKTKKEKITRQPSQLESESDGTDWTMGIIIAVIVNIVVSLLAWFFYRRWKRNQDIDLIDLSGDMG